MYNADILTPLKQKLNKKIIYGFDIETANNNKDFVCATLYKDDDNIFFFQKKDELISFMKQKRFKNSLIVATNLGFDFFGTFFNTDEMQNFKLIFRSSNLLLAKTNINNKHFQLKGKHPLIFLDTLNFAQMSVKDMGKILNIPKLEHPSFLGNIPKDKEEWQILREYNIQDARISKLFFEQIRNLTEEIGGTIKNTIASSSMHLFRSKYLKIPIKRHSEIVLNDLFKAYYGGRCEVFKRGKIENLNYYDVNSLYPSVMRNPFPNPNTLRITKQNNINKILDYEGVSEVKIFCPSSLKIPLLPVKKDKLIFPTGTIEGFYSHIELREALKLGYVIQEVKISYYYLENIYPFREYVDDLYKLRLENKSTPKEKIIKLYMNSLYGKFGQKYKNKDNVIHESQMTTEKINSYSSVERVGEYFRVNQEYTKPKNFCIPIWALYTTAYGRLKLYEYLKDNDPIYCDTDSIITKSELPTSDRLGELKKEMTIDYGIIVKPKFYFLKSKDKDIIKIKGVNAILKENDFNNLEITPDIICQKFVKFRECLRRKLQINEILEFTKHLNIDDDKRQWDDKINFKMLQESKPKTI